MLRPTYLPFKREPRDDIDNVSALPCGLCRPATCDGGNADCQVDRTHLIPEFLRVFGGRFRIDNADNATDQARPFDEPFRNRAAICKWSPLFAATSRLLSHPIKKAPYRLSPLRDPMD